MSLTLFLELFEVGMIWIEASQHAVEGAVLKHQHNDTADLARSCFAANRLKLVGISPGNRGGELFTYPAAVLVCTKKQFGHVRFGANACQRSRTPKASAKVLSTGS
jgi:hypothetical protein